MALDVRQNSVSTKYLENLLTYFHQILCMHSFWQDLAWNCYMSFFAHLYQSHGLWFTPKFHFRSISWEQNGQNFNKFYRCIHIDKIYVWIVTLHFSHIYKSYGPWFTPKFRFPSISWEQTDRFWPNFMLLFILTRSMLRLLAVIFRTFVPVLWPLIYAEISFPFNILRTNGQNFIKLYICIHIDKTYVGIITHHFWHICTWVMALDLLQKFVSAQYLKTKWTDLDQTLYNYLYWQDLRWVC